MCHNTPMWRRLFYFALYHDNQKFYTDELFENLTFQSYVFVDCVLVLTVFSFEDK